MECVVNKSMMHEKWKQGEPTFPRELFVHWIKWGWTEQHVSHGRLAGGRHHDGGNADEDGDNDNDGDSDDGDDYNYGDDDDGNDITCQ